jgi:transposase
MMNNKKVTFKYYNMDQLKLPMELEVCIPDNHLVKIVNSAIEKMNIDPLIAKYKGGGTSAYHPKMMLKVLVYAYSQRVYSSRKIAKELRENIHFLWISGKSKPDFRTINIFRSSIMKDVVDEVFASVVELLIQEGLVKLENYFLDGTKIEANANKYTFVWKKSTQKFKSKLQDKIKHLISEIDRINEEENKEYGNKDLEELGENGPVDSNKIDELVRKLDEKLANTSKKENKEEKKILKELKKDCLPRLKKYEQQEEILQERNSFSKTDKDATFMRMKEDHMKNGQLKPGYNIQTGTEGQFIVNYSVHQKANDTNTLESHLEKFKKLHKKLPEKVISDAGYGSEENYEILKSKEINAYVKYNNFHYEQKERFKKQIFRIENLGYDEELDEYICPNEKRLKYRETIKSKNKNGYESTIKIYECSDCSACPMKAECTKAKGNREIQVNERLNELKSEMREKLLSEKGVELRKKRCCEIESVFGQIKWNGQFKRFLLRGIEKVNTEWGLICMAHNMKKLALVK